MLVTDGRLEVASTFAEWLRAAMDAKKPGMTYRELETYSGVSRSVPHDVFTNPNYRPSEKTLRALAKYFGADFSELWAMVYAAPSPGPLDREQQIEQMLEGKSADEMLDLLPEGVREDIAMNFRRVPGKEETLRRLIRAYVADFLKTHPMTK